MSFLLDDDARLEAAVHEDGVRTTVTLAGELDRISGPPLARLLAATLAGTARQLDVGMADVCFVDVGGARVLMDAYRLAADRGVALALRDPQPHVVRVLHIMDPDTPLLAGHAGPAPAGVPPVTGDERRHRVRHHERRADVRERDRGERGRRH